MAIPLDPERQRYLESLFPGLAGRYYVVRDSPSKIYNCIAWALGSTSDWYWPTLYTFWPVRERRVTVACFAKLLESEGFGPATDAEVESGYAKIAMYVLKGVPTHMARIETGTVWSSKWAWMN